MRTPFQQLKIRRAGRVLEAIETLTELFTPSELEALDVVIEAFKRTPYTLIVRERSNPSSTWWTVYFHRSGEIAQVWPEQYQCQVGYRHFIDIGGGMWVGVADDEKSAAHLAAKARAAYLLKWAGSNAA